MTSMLIDAPVASMVSNRSTSSVVLQLYRLQRSFISTVKAGLIAAGRRNLGRAESLLCEALACRSQARALRINSATPVAELEIWRSAVSKLRLAIAKRAGNASRGSSSHTTERLRKEDVRVINKVTRLTKILEDKLNEGRSGLVLKLIARYGDVLVLYAPTLLIRLNTAAMAHFEALASELEAKVNGLVALELFGQAFDLIKADRYRDCRNKRQLVECVKAKQAEFEGKALAAKSKKSTGKSRPHGSPEQHERKGYTRRYTNPKTGEVKLIEVSKTTVNPGLKRINGVLVAVNTVTETVEVLSPKSVDTATSVPVSTPASEAPTTIMKAVAA